MEDKLELKHLKHYLDTGLKLVSASEQYFTNEIYHWKLIGLKNDTCICERKDYKNKINISIQTVKPILRPLSTLIDNILDDENDANYQLNCELADILESTGSDYFVKALIENSFYSVDVRKWNDIENFLNKYHFDWKHNLIEKGLAIDKNSLPNKI